MKSNQDQTREYYQSFNEMGLVFEVLAQLFFKKPTNNIFTAEEDEWQYGVDFVLDTEKNEIILTIEEFGITYRCSDMWDIYNAFMQIADIIAKDDWESEVYRDLENICSSAVEEIFDMKHNPEYL